MKRDKMKRDKKIFLSLMPYGCKVNHSLKLLIPPVGWAWAGTNRHYPTIWPIPTVLRGHHYKQYRIVKC